MLNRISELLDKPFIFFTPMDKLIWTVFWMLALASVIGIVMTILFIGFYFERARYKLRQWRIKRARQNGETTKGLKDGKH